MLVSPAPPTHPPANARGHTLPTAHAAWIYRSTQIRTSSTHPPAKARGQTLPTAHAAWMAAGVPRSATALGRNASIASAATSRIRARPGSRSGGLDPGDPMSDPTPDLPCRRPQRAIGAQRAARRLPEVQMCRRAGTRRAKLSFLQKGGEQSERGGDQVNRDRTAAVVSARSLFHMASQCPQPWPAAAPPARRGGSAFPPPLGHVSPDVTVRHNPGHQPYVPLKGEGEGTPIFRNSPRLT